MTGGRRLAAAALCATVLLAAACQQQAPDQVGEVTEATYSQQKAVPGFDDGEYTTTDAEQLAELQEVLQAYGLAGDISLGEACPGSTSTHVDYTTAQGSFTIDVEDCDVGEDGQALAGVVAGWHDRMP